MYMYIVGNSGYRVWGISVDKKIIILSFKILIKQNFKEYENIFISTCTVCM